jgi:aminoglycoside phosphotransferase family enzyme
MADSNVPLIRALLTRAECYGHPVGEVQLIETHISWVLLAGDYAYKIKKPVDLGFLDFSTLALRREACEEEVRLNRRLAPDYYLGVVAITGSPAAPHLGGVVNTPHPNPPPQTGVGANE